jgi:hypothetical protein
MVLKAFIVAFISSDITIFLIIDLPFAIQAQIIDLCSNDFEGGTTICPFAKPG